MCVLVLHLLVDNKLIDQREGLSQDFSGNGPVTSSSLRPIPSNSLWLRESRTVRANA